MKTISACVCGLVLACLLVSQPALPARAARPAGVIPVTTTIQAAINLANDGDTISIPEGTYNENLTINKSLTLIGPHPAMATVQAVGNQRVITVTSGHNLTLQFLTISGGFGADPGSNSGGGVYIKDGTLTVDHCILSNNRGNYGGGIFQEGTGGVIIQNGSQIFGNTATVDGGGIYAAGSLSLANSILLLNTAGRHGGAASVANGDLSAVASTISQNTAAQNGGGLNVNNGVSLINVVMQENVAGTNGGGVLQWNGTDGIKVTVVNSFFTKNQAGETGGAISIYQGASTQISNTQFTENLVNSVSVNTKGGAVYFNDASRGHDISIDHSTFQGNLADCTSCSFMFGGGVYASTSGSGRLILQDDTYTENDAWLGGGVHAAASLIERTTFQGNTAGSGGGAYLVGASEITQSNFYQNSTVNAGGALFVGSSAATFTVEKSKFVGNFGMNNLGGAMNLYAGNILLKNVVVADTQVFSGPAILLNNPSSIISIYHMTLTDTHLSGGMRTGTMGILIKGPTVVNIWNSMITDQETGILLDSGGAVLLDHTLWHNNLTNIGGSTDYNDISPVFGDPAYAVDRYHLTPASAAINHGVDRMVYLDIDGDARDSLPDIGADEFRVHVFLPSVLK